MVEIICPIFFRDLMIQRPHQLLKQFARSGYKSVIYNINGKSRKVFEVEENYFIYDGVFPAFPKAGKRILWISFPPLFKEIGRYQEDLLAFDCLDYPGERFAHWRRGFYELREKADVIFVSSEALREYNKTYQNKSFLCRNGVDFGFYADAFTKTLPQPKDMQHIRRPVVGYIGAVADWIDWNLIRYLASADKFSIVFAGPLLGLKEVPVFSNRVHFLGRKEYDTLPDYLSCFDVCIIPFRKNKLTEACNPIKMYEYLSMGKPVVTTDLAECRIDVVKYSKNYQQFYRNIVDSMSPQSSEEIQQRIDYARENSWENRVNYIRTILEPMLCKTE